MPCGMIGELSPVPYTAVADDALDEELPEELAIVACFRPRFSECANPPCVQACPVTFQHPDRIQGICNSFEITFQVLQSDVPNFHQLDLVTIAPDVAEIQYLKTHSTFP